MDTFLTHMETHPQTWFPDSIQQFLDHSYSDVVYSTQVQDHLSTACGQHCLFFLFNMQKGVSYHKYLRMFGANLPRNDKKVYNFVSSVKPAVCNEHELLCVQLCICGCNM